MVRMRLSTSFGRQAAGATALPGHLRMTYHALTWRSCRHSRIGCRGRRNDGRQEKPAIFISYSHKDEPERTPEGDIHWLTDNPGLSCAGCEWHVFLVLDLRGLGKGNQKTSSPLATSASFFVSRHSLASKYVIEVQIVAILERQRNGEPCPHLSDRCYRRFQRPPLQPPCWRSICGRGLTNPSPDFRVTTAVSSISKMVGRDCRAVGQEGRGRRKASATERPNRRQAYVHISGLAGNRRTNTSSAATMN